MAHGRFADTAYLIALLLPTDDLHSSAVAMEADDAPLVTSDAVLVELLAYFCSRGPHARSATITLVDRLRSDRRVTIVRQTPELFDEAFELYRSRPDKGYSLTDCMSMVICRHQDIADVLTHDHHFEQEGLRALF